MLLTEYRSGLTELALT